MDPDLHPILSGDDDVLPRQPRAQNCACTGNYLGAEFQLILFDGQPTGPLYFHRMREEIRGIDISLLPEYRNQGIGTHLLSGILEEGAESHQPVTILVEQFNRDIHL